VPWLTNSSLAQQMSKEPTRKNRRPLPEDTEKEERMKETEGQKNLQNSAVRGVADLVKNHG